MSRHAHLPVILLSFLFALQPATVVAQMVIINPPVDRPILPPHPRPRPHSHMLAVKQQRFATRIVDGVAETDVDQTFHNPYPHQVEGTYVFPLADDASVSGFSMLVNGVEIRGELLDRDEARRTYERIVTSMRDPALLEYVGSRLYKARIFPIPANGDVRLTLKYTQSLRIDDGLVTLTLPLRADAHTAEPAGSTSVSVEVRSQMAIKNVFSPTHAIRSVRPSNHTATVSFESTDTRSQRDFVLHYQLSEKEFGLAMLTYRDGPGDGFFMARIAPRSRLESSQVMAKDICFVIDTSGSMSGSKIAQARDALKYCLEHLRPDDRFNIIPFSHETQPFKTELQFATPANIEEALAFVQKLEAGGGTNINDALLTALRAPTAANGSRPFMIAFLTDGEPTVGVTEPKKIIANVTGANDARARLFVFGVGHDVNTKLLDSLAESNRGTREYVKPDENIEIKLSSFYRKVAEPVLSDLTLSWGGLPTPDRFPRTLPDLFAGSEIVIVGRYGDHGTRAIELTGRRRGATERFVYEHTFPERSTEHAFLPRLWATRKIGYLLDQIRLHGENAELKDEVVRLAKRYGIVTPYTAYLVTEDTKIALREGRRRGAADRTFVQLQERESGGRASKRDFTDVSGALAVDASIHMKRLRFAAANEVLGGVASPLGDRHGEAARGSSVEHVAGRTFYFNDDRWAQADFDARTETRKIELFSREYFDLLRKHPKLGKILSLGVRVIFRVGETWFETQPTA